MLSFAAIMPHPPIIVPEVGGNEVKKTEKTINALLKLGLVFRETMPEIVFLVSPHALILHDRIALGFGKKLKEER